MTDINVEFNALRGKAEAIQAMEAEHAAGEGSGDEEHKDADGAEASSEAAEGKEEESTDDGSEASSAEADGEEAAEGAEEASEGDEADADDPRDAEIARLTQQLTEKESKAEVKVTPVNIVVSDEEFEAAQENKEGLMALLNKVATASKTQGKEEALLAMPELVRKEVEVTKAIDKKVDEFWVQNKDLKPYNKVVGRITAELQAAHPNWDLNKLLAESEKVARKELKKPRTKITKTDDVAERLKGKEKEKVDPAFTSGTGARAEKKEPSPMMKEFNAMMGKRA
jgi:hypothetical protein